MQTFPELLSEVRICLVAHAGFVQLHVHLRTCKQSVHISVSGGACACACASGVRVRERRAHVCVCARARVHQCMYVRVCARVRVPGCRVCRAYRADRTHRACMDVVTCAFV